MNDKNDKNDKPKKLRRDDVRKLYAGHATSVRDQACVLLGGDPIQAQAVTLRVFASMIGTPAGAIAPEDLPAWLTDEVIRHCLEATGNGKVADWERYVVRHPDGPPEELSARPRDVSAPRSNVVRLRPRPGKRLPATRIARAAVVVPLPIRKPRGVARPEKPAGPEVES